MQYIQTDKAPAAIGPYSQAIKVGDMVYTSGQIALDTKGLFFDGTVKDQAQLVLQNLEEVLKEAGSSMQQVIKTTIFLADMTDFNEVNEVYAKAFGNHKPARSTIEVQNLPKDALIEIEAIAKID